jgi:site-specific recombinase XerD
LIAGKAYENKDLVFCNELGQALDPRAFTRKYERMLEAAGLEKVSFNSLRHTVAILAIKNGVPVKTVQDLLGHEDFSTTMNLYGDHVDSEMLENAVMTLNNLLNKKISSTNEEI